VSTGYTQRFGRRYLNTRAKGDRQHRHHRLHA
jgi:hypothetical protein